MHSCSFRLTNTCKNIFLLLLAVAFFVSAFPSFFSSEGLPVFAWFSFVPVFLLLAKNDAKICLLSGFIYGFFCFLALCYWLKSYGFLVLFLIALYHGAIYAVLFFILKKIGDFYKEHSVFLCPLILVLFEFLRTKGFLGFSYGIMGYSQYRIPFFVSFASLFGVYGVSFLIFYCSSILSAIPQALNSEKLLRNHLCFYSALFFILIFLNLGCFMHGQKSADRTVSVCAVQPDFKNDSVGIEAYFSDFERLRKITDRALLYNPEIEVVVWPETAIVPDILFYLDFEDDFASKKRHELSVAVCNYINSKNCIFVLGNNRREAGPAGERRFNSALVFYKEDGSQKIAFYDKTHLVPFAERIPLKGAKFSLIKKLAEMAFSDDYDRGQNVTVFKINDFAFSVSICFEDSFPLLSMKMRRNGADFLLNITDDSWSESMACQNQHMAMSVFRAAENGIPVVRSSVNGKTCFIDFLGRIKSEMKSFEGGYLTDSVEFYSKNAVFFNSSGFIILYMFFAVAFASLLPIFYGFVKIKIWQMKNRKRT